MVEIYMLQTIQLIQQNVSPQQLEEIFEGFQWKETGEIKYLIKE